MGTLIDGLGCFPLDYGSYHSQSDSQGPIDGIRSLIRFGNRVRPLAYSVLYPHQLCLEASPKAISGRTSYLRVRLAFHPYPQLIHRLFNDGWFEPPRCLTIVSLWPWVDHPVSGLHQLTLRPLKTRFRYGSVSLTLLVAATRRSVLQKVRRHSFLRKSSDWL